jgi:putative endonuclease
MKDKPKSFYVYILNCSDNTFYTGYTDDLEKRLEKHNGIVPGGSKYTRSRRPVKIVYYEQFDNKSDAMKREAEIKKMSREEKSFLIESI